MTFWDASALVPLVVSQGRTADMQMLFGRDSDMFVWWAAPVECVSALSRMVREMTLDEARADAAIRNLRVIMDACNTIEPSLLLRDTAVRLIRVHPLRSGDALQLAAAITACAGNPGTMPFVCLDKRLSTAARKEGFTVVE